MMSHTTTFLALVLASVCAFSTAFAPVTFQPARIIAGSSLHRHLSHSTKRTIFRMSEEPTEGETKEVEVSADGTFYDDEVEPAPNVGISNSMKDRLTREASTGMDSEKKQTNVILYIIAVIGVLVALGGSGILY